MSAFGVPASDLYQIAQQHPFNELVAEGTGLGIPRSGGLVFLSITRRPPIKPAKLKFYRGLRVEIESSCNTSGDDVVVSITVNGDADCSFGRDRAQFVTGEL